MMEIFELPTSLEDLYALERKLLDWAIEGRADKAVEYLDEKFTVISFHGHSFKRDHYVRMSVYETRVERGHFESLEITHEGNFAVSTGLLDVVWSRGDLKLSGPLRFTKVWVRRPEGWRMLHLHTTDARLGASWAQTFGKPLA